MDRPLKPADTFAARRARFKQAVFERRALLLPGVANALGARIVEDLGFEAVYLTGAGLANTEFGVPDLGLVTMSEFAEATLRISDACALPLVVDIDTGFGNALNVTRTIRAMERAGAAAVQIEDQVFPKAIPWCCTPTPRSRRRSTRWRTCSATSATTAASPPWRTASRASRNANGWWARRPGTPSSRPTR